MKISIFGAGHMARGIGTRLVSGGHTIILYDRQPYKANGLADELQEEAKRHNTTVISKQTGAPIEGEIVILALPFREIDSYLKKYQDQLKDKILVDISNPLDFKTFEFLLPPDTSAAEEIAKKASSSKVVKAFNTAFAATLINGQVAGQILDIFIAGDDEKAKTTIMELIEDGGLRPLDVGPLKRARGLEWMGMLHMTLQQGLNDQFSTALKILP